MGIFADMSDSPLLPSAPGFSPVLFFFCRTRWDAQLTHNPQTHTEAYTNTDVQVPDVLLHSLTSDLQRSWSIVAQKRGKQTNK